MSKINFLSLLLFLLFFGVVVNEFLPVPEGNEPEWIEIYNNSDSTFTFSKTYIADATSSKLLPEFKLKSKNYAVITKDTAILKQIRTIPDSTILIQLTLPTLNNTYDNIILKSAEQVYDSIYYHISFGENGKSFERINPDEPALSKTNLKSSINIDGATCGFVNSHYIYSKDLKIENFSRIPKSDSIIFEILNTGKQKIENFELQFFIDVDNDKLFTNDELFLINNYSLFDLSENKLTMNLRDIDNCPIIDNYLDVMAVILSPDDLNRSNDTLRAELYFSSNQNSIIINEIMYDVEDEIAEFIELYNRSEKSVNLRNSELKDENTKLKKGVFIDKDIIVEPNNFLLVAWDSLFFVNHPELKNSKNVYISKNSSFNLNQSGDFVALVDANGYYFDSLTYSDKWHTLQIDTKNTSLERINYFTSSEISSSWATCIDLNKSTPANKNSVFAEISNGEGITCSPNPFLPNSSDKPFCIIGYKLPFEIATLTLSIYDTQGKKIVDVANGINSKKIGSLVWDGKNSDGFNLSSGRYVILLNAYDNNSNESYSDTKIVVIGN